MLLQTQDTFSQEIECSFPIVITLKELKYHPQGISIIIIPSNYGSQEKNSAYIIDAKTGAPLSFLDPWCITDAAEWSPSGNYIATICNTEKKVKIWDTHTNNLLATIDDIKDATAVAWGPKGDYCIGITTKSGGVHIYNFMCN